MTDDMDLGDLLDSLPRAELGETELGRMPWDVAGVLGNWLWTQHGVASGHHAVGSFLEMLAAAGYRVTAIEAPEFEHLLPPATD